MDQAAVKRYLGVVRRACDLIEQQLDAEVSAAFQEVLQQTIPPVPTPAPANVNDAIRFTTLPPAPSEPDPVPDPSVVEARKKHVESLMAIDCWPLSVPAHAVGPTTDGDQINRARAVLDYTLGSSIEGAHFLDYGCGEGYIAAEAAQRGCAEVTGFDIEASPSWNKHNGVRFTRRHADLKPKKYDLIFLYDVLDHCHDPVGLMAHVNSLIVTGGTIFARCHPWTSKHASHLPKVGLNKAFIHLFLTHDELTELGYKPMFTRVEKKPLEAYRWWFHNFKIVTEKMDPRPVSDFFHVPAFKELLAVEQELASEEVDGFLEMMKFDFIDYVLQNPK